MEKESLQPTLIAPIPSSRVTKKYLDIWYSLTQKTADKETRRKRKEEREKRTLFVVAEIDLDVDFEPKNVRLQPVTIVESQKLIHKKRDRREKKEKENKTLAQSRSVIPKLVFWFIEALVSTKNKTIMVLSSPPLLSPKKKTKKKNRKTKINFF